jgi:HNH endonuclease
MPLQYTPKDMVRFWAKIDRSGDCWVWTAATGNQGYGQFVVNHRKIRAHRIAFELAYGPIPTGLLVLHRCDNPPCCNPDHLFLGTQADNVDDMVEKRRHGTHVHPERRATGSRHGSQTKPEKLKRGEAVHTARLTADDVRDIRARAAAGSSQRKLAALYGVAQSNIAAIVLRKTWKHID